MNVETGRMYPSLSDALDAGEDPSDVVEVVGTEEQVQRLSDNVAAANAKAKRRARSKRARASRKRNRS